ncbi:uncharacterized protein LOC129944472 isoform X2 [Eupeodes corollae]|uniref:uncharacterized protein LOC129944472 isoform X2 n=1 Tax=Eupeodes corollae TaxID=290404 RepID=UPI002492FF6B|nr:uncharacterized protein LOC129944472 isoform X2 [Eupeodes corollae]
MSILYNRMFQMSGKVLFIEYCGASTKLVTGGIMNGDYFPQNHAFDSEQQFGGAYHRSVEATTECVPSSKTNSNISLSGPMNNQNAANPSKNNENNLATGAAGAAGAAGATGATGAAGAAGAAGPATTVQAESAPSASVSKLYALVQHIYAAQARVQLEVNEIKKAQAVANSAQKTLEEASNNVRVITSALQAAQQEVATAAVRAQTAQMQLAAHDQLLFAARQKVDALSSQMVGLQVEDGVASPKNLVNVQGLMSQLKQPLPQNQTPTPIPAVDKPPNGGEGDIGGGKGLLDYDYFAYDSFN